MNTCISNKYKIKQPPNALSGEQNKVIPHLIDSKISKSLLTEILKNRIHD
jgi:hypothetical protein